MAASLHLASYTPRAAVRMIRAMRSNRSRLKATPGLAASSVFFTAELDPMMGGTPKLTKWGYFCGWENAEARDDFMADDARLAPFTDGASEVWSLSLDTARVVQGDWRGWRPAGEETPPLEPGEPLAVMTYGRLRARYLPTFTWNNRKVVRAMIGNPGLAWMIGLGDTPMVRATFSLWRSKGDVVRFAYGDGVHNPIQRRSLEVPWANDYFFARFRPVASSGTWDGRDPLADASSAAERRAEVAASDVERSETRARRGSGITR